MRESPPQLSPPTFLDNFEDSKSLLFVRFSLLACRLAILSSLLWKKSVCMDTVSVTIGALQWEFRSRKAAVQLEPHEHNVNKKREAYVTSYERDFIHRPILSLSIRPKTSGRVSRSLLDDPVGATVYSEDFCWRPVPKTACIRSATASGNRSNNPHPSKAFMIWRHYTDQMKQFDGSSPLQLHFTEKEIQKALSDQYRSTYKSDFLGLPQVIMKKHAFIVPFNHNQAVHYFTQTEMRHNYRSPIIKPELLGNTSRYGCNKLHGVAARGIGEKLMVWPLSSPDLNPIEILRSIRKQKIYKGIYKALKQQLWKAIRQK
ncbi:testis-expressed protein 26-like [Danio aesculapii]|uniref:testis-expressed protein 26-like n=1 Tax=Danio aesculapii TaxID=1142201 RepID=UPI0024BF9982|nr:testis-expressed protein 26-like [Danio aesculapii]